MREEVLHFDCQGEGLLGVLSVPDKPPRLGAVVVVGGPQYRVGSHRQFVGLARALAKGGIAALRFDVRGMGDSQGATRDFESIDDDVDAAVNAVFATQPSIEGVVLIGLCDGASAALMHVEHRRGDARIAGVVVINPWVRSDASLAKAQVQHYYAQRLRDRDFWAKLLRGGVSWRAPGEYLRKVLHSRRASLGRTDRDMRTFQQRMADGWAHIQAPIWLVVSGKDLTAAEFVQCWTEGEEWRAARSKDGLRKLELPDADHTLSQRSQHARFTAWLVEELKRVTPHPAPPRTTT